MKAKWLLSSFWVATLLLAGCVTPTIRTRSLTGTNDVDGTAGLSYYLPMRYATVTFERKLADSKASEANNKAKEVLAAAEVTLKTAEAGAKSQSQLIETLKKGGFDQGSETFKGALLSLVKAHQDVASAKTAVANAAAMLEKAETAEAQFNAAQEMCGYVDSIAVELLPYVPDTSVRYRLDPKTSAFRTDTFSIGTTPSGLLKTTNSILSDQTSQILVSLAQSVAAIDGTPPSFLTENKSTPILAEVRPNAPRCSDQLWRPVVIKQIIDPADDNDWSSLQRSIRAATIVKGKTLLIANRTFEYSLKITGNIAKSTAPTPSNAANGIFYRRERPIVIDTKLGDTSIGGFVLVVPNNAYADLLKVDATTFATNKTSVGFENGMLVSLDIERPSPVVEVVALPWKIARATIGVLTELIQFRVNYATGEADVIQQQAELARQMKELLDAQAALIDKGDADAEKTP